VLSGCAGIALQLRRGDGQLRRQPLLGVLEQSWRVGGATGAELAALAAFQTIRNACATASTREKSMVPMHRAAGADIYFQEKTAVSRTDQIRKTGVRFQWPHMKNRYKIHTEGG
jgi:hypothetical protein